MKFSGIPTRSEERAIIQVVRRLIGFAICARRRVVPELGTDPFGALVQRVKYDSYISAAKIAAEPLIMRRFR